MAPIGYTGHLHNLNAKPFAMSHVPPSELASATPTDWPIPDLPLCRLRFHFKALDPIRLPYFSGSAWRGLLGHSLRRSVCVTRAPHCDGCLLRGQCIYSRVFETPPRSREKAQRYSALPHPFVLEPPPAGQRDVAPGESLSLGMTLIGSSQDLPAYLTHSWQRAGEHGIGAQNSRFELIDVTQEQRLGEEDWISILDRERGELQPVQSRWRSPDPRPDPLEIELLTPLRIKHRGQFVNEQRFSIDALFLTLTTRLALLAELYSPSTRTPGAEPAPTTSQLQAALADIRWESDHLRWVDWTRWSSRQHTQMQLGGLLGTLRLSGSGLNALWPMIVLGQWVHLGKQSSFGLGHYRILPAATGTRSRTGNRL